MNLSTVYSQTLLNIKVYCLVSVLDTSSSSLFFLIHFVGTSTLTTPVCLWVCLSVCFCQVPSLNGQLGGPVRGQMTSCQTPMARHPSREQLIDYLMLKVSHGQQPLGPPPPRADHDTLQQEVGWGGWMDEELQFNEAPYPQSLKHI